MPAYVLEGDCFAQLSPRAVKLLIDLGTQYRGNNNGDFQMSWKHMQTRGWKSKQQLYLARDELVESGFIVVSRQGGKNRCSLYALTFFAIDECDGKLDIPETRVAPNDWRKPKLVSVPRISEKLVSDTGQ